MAKFSNGKWSKNTTGESAADYCRRCLINNNTGPSSTWVKSKCHLPVKTRGGGTVSKSALRNASSRINQVKGSGKAAAATKLASLKRAAGVGTGKKAK